MRKMYYPFILIFALLMTGCSPDVLEESVTLNTIQGEKIVLPAKDNQWIVLNFWASWCAPCRKEIPDLNALHQSHDDITVIGVNVEKMPLKALKKTIEETHIQFPVVSNDPSLELKLPPYPGLPATFILSPKGEWLAPKYGLQTEESLLKAMGKA